MLSEKPNRAERVEGKPSQNMKSIEKRETIMDAKSERVSGRAVQTREGITVLVQYTEVFEVVERS